MFFKIILEFVAIPLLLILVLTGALKLGGWLYVRHLQNDAFDNADGVGVVDGAVFGLMGLLLAFAFSGAAQRFDVRRTLIVEEANNIGTAWLRLELLPGPEQTEIRQKFRQYLDARLETYKDVTDLERVNVGLAATQSLQNEIWALAVAGADKARTTSASMLLLPSLNDMFDIVTTRTASTQMHPPTAIFVLLIVVMVLCGTLAGYRMGTSSQLGRFHRLSFVAILAFTFYVIIDMEYPRLGFIRVDEFDQVIAQLGTLMGR